MRVPRQGTGAEPGCSSDETSVMEVERRPRNHRAFYIDQPETGGVIGKSKAVCDI